MAAEDPAPQKANDTNDPELTWLRTVYRRGQPQLTIRAILTGMVLGAVMCLSNLYVVLKTGWSLGVTVTACILAYAAFRVMHALRLTRRDFSILENNAMGSVASAAGYMTGGGNMAAIPALMMLGGTRPDGFSMAIWFALIAALGVFAAIPIKRQLINIEQLPFPTGIATAETLKSLHAHAHSPADSFGDAKDGAAKESEEAGAGKARLLAWAAVIGAIVAFLRDAKAGWKAWKLPNFEPPFSWGGHKASEWTVSVDASFILMGVGALIGFRTCVSLVVASLATYGWIAPWAFSVGAIESVAYKKIVQWTLWPGAAVLLSSGLLAFAFQWRSVAKSFSGLSKLFIGKRQGTPGGSPGPREETDPMAAIECPSWWFPAGFLVLGPIVVYMMWRLFAIPWWAGLVALPLSVMMGIVAARVTGETDITPTKALGPVTQFIYGAMVPRNMPANVMGANVTGGVGLHAADLLTDLKSGYLVGANPRQQFFAQLFGVVAGAAAVVPAFNLIIPDASYLGSKDFPAPAVQVWKGVSEALVQGIDQLHPTARYAALIGLAIGTVLTLAERYAPAKVKPYVPSPAGIGIALVTPCANAIAMFIGSAAAEIARRRSKAFADRSVVPVASGLIAGESLMGILVAVLIAFGVMQK